MPRLRRRPAGFRGSLTGTASTRNGRSPSLTPEIRRCPQCGYFEVVIPRPDALHRTIAAEVIRKPARLSGPEFVFLRSQLEMSARGLAKTIGVVHESISALGEWCAAGLSAGRSVDAYDGRAHHLGREIPGGNPFAHRRRRRPAQAGGHGRFEGFLEKGGLEMAWLTCVRALPGLRLYIETADGQAAELRRARVHRRPRLQLRDAVLFTRVSMSDLGELDLRPNRDMSGPDSVRAMLVAGEPYALILREL